MQTPPPTPTPAPGVKPSAWSRYRGASRGLQIGMGCGFLIVVCFLCAGVSAGLGAAFGKTTPTASSSSQVARAQNTSTNVSLPDATATHAPTATPKPTATPQPTATNTPVPPPPATATPCADPCNPWGYNFSPGNYITQPPSDFCSYFNCIASFWNGTGYVMECVDATFSLSGGHQGSCSHHGGDWRPLYSH